MAGEHAVYVNRIVGLPREKIAIASGVVLVNDSVLIEPDVVYKAPWDVPPVTLADDEYFVIGDNRAMAARDHDFGTTPRARIVGKMLF